MQKKKSFIIIIPLILVVVFIVPLVFINHGSTNVTTRNNVTSTPQPTASLTPLMSPSASEPANTPTPTPLSTSIVDHATPTPTIAPTVAPTTPPSSSQPILCVGDSITFGAEVSTPYPEVLQSLTGNLTVNAGQSGAQTPTIRSDYDAAKNSMNFSYLVILAGINDITHNPPDQAIEDTIESNLLYIWQDAQSRGMHVCALTLTPFGGYAAYNNATQTELFDVNAWINATAPTLGVKVVNTNIALGDPINPDYMQSNYDSGDHLHPDQAGANVIATLVAAALS